jgi:putative ABC transport system substrate-binding protein
MRGFRDALRDVGYIEGQNVRLEVRSADGKTSVLQERAAELVLLKVDVIVTSLTPTALAAKRATTDIPIVMAAAGDPVGTGLVASLARPGGNVTGVSAASAEIAGKSLELMREVIPSAHRVAVLVNNADPFGQQFLEQTREGARALGIEVDPVMAGLETRLEADFDTMSSRKTDAILLQGGMLRMDVFELATKSRLPIFSSNRQVAVAGGLIVYAANAVEVHRQGAEYVDKILKGAKPADLPVTLPTRFELVINLKVAKALGISIPPTLLARADEVIE